MSLVVRDAGEKRVIRSQLPAEQRTLTASVRQERTLIDGLLHNMGIVLRYKWLVLVLTFLAGAAAVGFAYMTIMLPPERSPMPNTYRSNAVLLMGSGGADATVLTFLSSLGMEGRGAGSVDYGQIAVMILRSRSTVDRVIEDMGVIERYGITENPRTTARELVQAGLGFYYDRPTGALDISFESTDPVFSRDMVARMLEVLAEWFAQTGVTTRSKQLEVLEEKLAEVSRETTRLESEIKGIQSEHNALTIVELASSQSALLNNLRSQRATKDMELRSQREFSTIDDPRTALLRIELANLNELIRQVQRGEYPSMPPQEQIPELAATFARLNLELTIQQRIYQTLSEQYEVAKLSNVDEEVYRILEYPEVAEKKTGPERSQLVLMITAGGFFAGVGLAFLLNTVGSVRRDPERLKMLLSER